ncbi:DNA-binding protein [Streptomyces bacillaris]|uniref:DNA-binding protein n=1 Tax=Streptomyces bacillaris TaxID=68179 RepID=UPI0037F78811
MRSGLGEQSVIGIEVGREWVDQHSMLCALAGSLHLDPLDLTGQPYAPNSEQHATVRAAAWHLRRHLFHSAPHAPAEGQWGRADLLSAAEEVRDAQASGDERALALALPPLLVAADHSVGPEEADRPEAMAVRNLAYAAAAGLLRRLGYCDLAWSLLHRAHPVADDGQVVQAEEVRLLTSMGMSGPAAARAEQHFAAARSVALLCAAAFAHASAGQRLHAEHLLDEADRCASDAGEAAEVTVTRASSAMQFGAWDQVLEQQGAAATMPSARRADLLLLVAGAWARRGQINRAFERLAAAETAAALYIRLDPLARELLHALRARARGTDSARELGSMAGRFGMK